MIDMIENLKTVVQFTWWSVLLVMGATLLFATIVAFVELVLEEFKK